jgi:hypothetical protein
MKHLLTSAMAMLSGVAIAQCGCGPINANPDIGIINGVYLTEHIPTKRKIPYEHVREADVTWSKRVWRSIDMREKINHPMYLPFDSYDAANVWQNNSSRYSLWTILKCHIMNGDLVLFSPDNPYDFMMRDGDQFKYPIVSDSGGNYFQDSTFRQRVYQYLGQLGPQPIVPLADMYGDDSTIIGPGGIPEFVYPPRDTVWTLSKDIVQYRIKEDWFFDKERSIMDVRILGIAPVIHQKDPNGQITGTRETFWIYFPHARNVLNNYFVYNDKNDAQWMSFDDFFWKRRFSSTIYKESNVFDREVESYRTGVDALLESEKITEEIRNFEHDVWHF